MARRRNPFDLAAEAIADKVALVVASEIASLLRRAARDPRVLDVAPRDRTAAARQRRSRERRRADVLGDAASQSLSFGG